MSTGVTHVPDYLLERYALGELPTAQMRELDQRVQQEPDLAARLEAMASSNQEILRQYPPAWFAAEIASRVGTSPRRVPGRAFPWVRSPLLILVPAMTAALAALFILRAPDDATGPIPGLAELTETRIKGLEPYMNVYRKTDDHAERVDSTTVVQGGDVLQLSYVAAGKAHGVIVSVDGRGSTTLHFPETVMASTALLQQGETPILHAYEIDDAPEFERFFFVTDSLPIPVDEVLRAAEDLARAPENARRMMLPLASAEQHAVLVHKKEVRQ